MNPVVYDAGVLIAADRNVRQIWADHRVRLEAGVIPTVPTAVVAQTSRSPNQVQLRRLLLGCEVIALTEQAAHEVGHLLGRAGTSDIADATVAQAAAERHADVMTSDPDDMRRLLQAAKSASHIIAI
jgi:predicted nucleic acid-binding protein